jgi:uncharacterized protein with GYD domain
MWPRSSRVGGAGRLRVRQDWSTIDSPAIVSEGADMATYILLSTLTDEGRKTLKERPERMQEVNREIEAMGGRVTQQYAVLGGYDFVNILEAPDNETVARISVELGARGTIQLTTLPAISVEQFTQMLKGAK